MKRKFDKKSMKSNVVDEQHLLVGMFTR
jgi:hypothetical protein